MTQEAPPGRRIYPLDDPNLTEEQIAVIFAMTSRSPDSFDEIASHVSGDKAAQFHEKYVLDYGHASVAEHAVLHLAIENISRLACDTIEDNRLASFTEKSSRYQVIQQGYFHTPRELDQDQGLLKTYQDTCNHLFNVYHDIVPATVTFLKENNPRQEKESDQAYNLRLRRIATDSGRSVLPASTLTNVGLTANARTMEHAITKLLSSNIQEEVEIGEELLEKARSVTPTLVKYAQATPHLQKMAGQKLLPLIELEDGFDEEESKTEHPSATLLAYDHNLEENLAAALLYSTSHRDYRYLRSGFTSVPREVAQEVNTSILNALGPHDTPPREFETASYLFEFTLDYGAYREFKRHRMQTTATKPPSPAYGFSTPPLIRNAGQEGKFRKAIQMAEETHNRIRKTVPAVAPYALTHAHHRKVLTKVNLRQLYHLFKLRTSPQAHAAIRQPMQEALEQIKEVHPNLFRHLLEDKKG